MKNFAVFLAGFISALALSALTLWLTGYNFDERNAFAASWFGVSFVVAVLAGLGALENFGD